MEPCGSVDISIVPVDEKGEPLEYLGLDDDPYTCLLGKIVSIEIIIENVSLEGVEEKNCFDTFVEFDIFGAQCKTDCFSGSCLKPSFSKCKFKIDLDPLDSKSINMIDQGCISFRVYGYSEHDRIETTVKINTENNAEDNNMNTEKQENTASNDVPSIPLRRLSNTLARNRSLKSRESSVVVTNENSGLVPVETILEFDCDHCSEKKAVLVCIDCKSKNIEYTFCTECCDFLHQALSKKSHVVVTIERFNYEYDIIDDGKCDNCEENAYSSVCNDCERNYCTRCDLLMHKAPSRSCHKRLLKKHISTC